MATISNFTDLKAWKEAHELTLIIYRITKDFPKDENYGLKQQLRRAVISVESCIAEGFSRYHYKDRNSFYYRSRGSLAEVYSQIITAKDLDYINSLEFDNIIKQLQKTGALLGGLINSTTKLSKE